MLLGNSCLSAIERLIKLIQNVIYFGYVLNILYQQSSNQTMFSEYHQDWVLTIKKMVAEHENNSRAYHTTHKDVNTRSVHKKCMKLFQGARKLYLFINRTKLQYFSFQPRILNLWRTITQTRNNFMTEINTKLMDESYTEKARKYLKLFKKTLEKYDSTYGLQVGILLHVKFGKDIALVINQYLL